MEGKKDITGYSTHELRSWFGWTQVDLSEQFGIPLRTIQNWDSRKCMPAWVESMAREIRASWNQIIAQERSIKVLTGEIEPEKGQKKA